MAATLADPHPATQGSAKPTHAFVWGDNPHGALGLGGSGRVTTPAKVLLPDDLVATAAGAGFSLGVTRTGQVWSWGTNDYGQLGDGTTTHRLTPVAVKIPAGTRVRSVFAGRYHALALTDDGSVLAWGRNQVGQVGDGTITERHEPVRVQLAGRPSDLAAGSFHSLAIVRGELLAWGGLFSSEAVGPAAGSTVPTALQLGKRVTAATVRTGASATAIIDTRHTVHIWGRHFGSPQQPITLPRRAFALGVGDGHVITLNSDGSLTSIGANGSGQLGDGTTTLRTEPVTWRLPAGGRPADIGVAGDHTVVVTRDARVYTWGANTCAIIAPAVWTTAGTFMLLFLAALQDIPEDVEETAQMDGTSAWQRFRAVTLPGLKRTLFLVVTLGLIGTWQVFDQIYITSQGGPAKSTVTPAYLSYQTSFLSGKWGQGAAIAFILFAIIVIFSLFQRYVMRDRKTLPRRRRFATWEGK